MIGHNSIALPLSDLCVVVCTHNPRPEFIELTLNALRAQRLPLETGWELLIIDNASSRPLKDQLDISWHPKSRIIRENRLGLTHARLRGMSETKSEIIVYVDDDNILDDNYLSQVVEEFRSDLTLGAIGGRVLPQYKEDPPDWVRNFENNLACRDLGDFAVYALWDKIGNKNREYPACAPVGAGMSLRRDALITYLESVIGDPIRSGLDRTGSSLASAGDNDIVMTVLAAGWRVAYLPNLLLAHLIPAERLTRTYLARLTYESSKTWVTALNIHGIRPWPAISRWSVPIRKARAYLNCRAWSGNVNYIHWRGACGQFDGRSLLKP